MVPQDVVKSARGGCILSVDVSPGADVTEIMGVNQWRGAIHIRVAAQPKEEAANEELVRFLSSELGIPVRSVTIVKGAKSSRKTIHIALEADRVKDLLGRS